MPAMVGETRTDATPGGMTTTVAMPDLPPELAAMCAVPSATPVTTPVPETVAIDVSSELQKMLGLPDAPSTTACRVTVEPSATVSGFGEMVTPLPPFGPVESLPHDNATEQASAERKSRKVDRRAARIEHSLWRGSHASARATGHAEQRCGG